MKKAGFIIFVIVCCLIILTGTFYLCTGKGPTVGNVKEAVTGLDLFNKNVAEPVGTVEKLFSMKVPNVKTIAEEVQSEQVVKTIYLYLDDGCYYPVCIPASLEVVTDYNKYIYATDCSLSVTVMSNVPIDDMSSYVKVRDAVPVDFSTVRSEAGTVGPQEAAKHIVNDKAIVVRAYENPKAFATVLRSLQDKVYIKRSEARLAIDKRTEDIDGDGVTVEMKELPIYTGYHLSLSFDVKEHIQQAYLYDDGQLAWTREFKQFEDALSSVAARVNIVTGEAKVDKIYQDDIIYYAEIKECTVALTRLNYNTTIIMFGTGEEARYNIATYLRGYKGEQVRENGR